MKKIFEFRWHGQGSQDAWTTNELSTKNAYAKNKCTQSFPKFRSEQVDALMTVFTQINTEPIRLHSAIYRPDVSTSLDFDKGNRIYANEYLTKTVVMKIPKKQNNTLYHNFRGEI